MIDLRQGDCLEVMKEMLDKSIDLTVTSPPYDNLRTYNGNIDQWNFDKFKDIAKELYRITKKGGVVVWVVGDQTIKGSESGTSFKQALYFKEIGFNLHDTMIWKKSNPFNFGSNNCYIQSFEYMFVFSKGKPKSLNFIHDRVNKSKGDKIISQTRDGDFMKYDAENSNYITKELGKRHNVWDIPTSSGRGKHPAVFPEQLAHDHIISWSNEGDTVLDCFMGSGTTGVACINTNRNFIGIELDETYFNIAKDRLNGINANGQTSIFTDFENI